MDRQREKENERKREYRQRERKTERERERVRPTTKETFSPDSAGMQKTRRDMAAMNTVGPIMDTA